MRLQKIDKSGLFLVIFLLTNIYVFLEFSRRNKFGKFIEKFNSRAQEIFVEKYSERTDFSDHKFIKDTRVTLLRSLINNLDIFWLKIIKTFENSVVELTPEDIELQKR